MTEAGQLYFERSKRIVDEARLAHEQLGEMLAQPSGVLRVSLPVDFATFYLTPLVAEFARRYPGINFEFDLSPRRVDLVTDPVDVAIRMGELPNSDLDRAAARRDCHATSTPRRDTWTSPVTPSQPDDLAQHECLRLRTGAADLWRCTMRTTRWRSPLAVASCSTVSA